MKTKDFRANVKAVGGEQGNELAVGQFEAIVSVFGNVDTYGDMVVPGAFKADLDARAESGAVLPVVWSHKWDDPFAHIGWVVKAEERPEGLWVQAELDMDNPTAQQVHKLLKSRRVSQFSFAYDVQDHALATAEDGTEYLELRKLKLHEVGPCLVGVNQETELLAAKGFELAAKAGRVLSQKNLDTITAARDALQAVLDAANTETTDEAKAAGPGAMVDPEGDHSPGTENSQPMVDDEPTDEPTDDRESDKDPAKDPAKSAHGPAMTRWELEVLLLED